MTRQRRRNVLLIALLGMLIGLVSVVDPPLAASQEPTDEPAAVGAGVVQAVAAAPALVVVAFDAPIAQTGSLRAASAIGSTQRAIVAALPAGSILDQHRFKHVPAMTLTIDDPSVIAMIAAVPGVRRVDLDVGGAGMTASAVPLIGADVRQSVGNGGDGVVVAIVDSGIDSDHPDLVADIEPAAGHVCFGYDGGTPDGVGFCPNGTESQTGAGAAEDDNGHGTRMAGIVSSDGIVASAGFAPGAELLPLKVLDSGNSFYSFTLNLVEALDYLIDNPGLGVDIVSMTVGTSFRYTGDCDTASASTMAGASAVDTLRAAGVIVVAAAGNDSDPTTMRAPACLSNVISVAASDDFDVRAPTSNRSSTLDLFGPGVDVDSSWIGGVTSTNTGTSTATAAVAGCAALLIESGDAVTPAAIETRLTTSTVSIDGDNGFNYPRVECGIDGCLASITVATEAELATAIGCYNQSTAGATDILVANDITLTGPLPTIDNSTAAALEINGQGYTLDGDGATDSVLVLVDGDLKVQAITISGAALDGDAIAVGDTLAVHDSTLTGNGYGVTATSGAVVTIENSTIADNTNDGIWVSSDATSVLVTYSTIADNTQHGIGVGAANQVQVAGSIIARNGLTACAGGFMVDDLGGTAVGDTSCTGVEATGIGASLDAGLLANGCTIPCTHTVALLTGSPAIDLAGECPLNFDQRLADRVGLCDAGAFELPTPFSLCDTETVTIDLAFNGGKGTGTSGNDVIKGTSGADTIRGGAGDDYICGNTGADLLIGGPGNDNIYAGEGADEISGGGGDDIIFGGPGDDMIEAGAGLDNASGGGGDDVISGQGAADYVSGGQGADVLDGQNGGDELHGGSGDDIIRGQTGPDVMYGGPDNDSLIGGGGNDTLFGGPGTDACAGNTGPADAAQSASCQTTPGVEVFF